MACLKGLGMWSGWGQIIVEWVGANNRGVGVENWLILLWHV